MDNTARYLMQSIKTSQIDQTIESREEFQTKLLVNDHRRGNSVLANLDKELADCEEFLFSVAFITKSGLVVLKQRLRELQERGIKGKILTTDYLQFSEPGALRELLGFDNIEVRVFTEEHFHTKGYIFTKNGISTMVVGSSNLTQSALKANKEWNLRVTSLENGKLIKDTLGEFEFMWNKAELLTTAWISEYEKVYQLVRSQQQKVKVTRLKQRILQPNTMQIQAVRALAHLRLDKKNKALLISATGTGKTYLSAFDVRNVKPKRLLFLVHREQILKQAMESYQDVLGEGSSIGLLTGNTKDWEQDYLFSTIQMMSKPEVHTQFAEDYFDYIIIDESHKAGAKGYRRIMEYFKPKFMLGMTATPERNDGYDIYELFDHNVAYEIRLQQAMEADLLCPFHYFGVTDLMVDGRTIHDTSEFDTLISEERVNNIIDKIEYYGYSGDRVKGLMFCRSVQEAEALSKAFNEKGYQTMALSGADSQELREEAVERLEQDEREGSLDYIFTVDIFNEGVDIPSVNQVVMLRPTQSSIIFVQQLGRGLRKYPGKEYLVVIDFIGNYKNNFLIPIALYGDRTFNKDTIRKYVAEGNRVIPGCSTVNYDAIAKERIYQSINTTNFATLKFLKEQYLQLKSRLGRIPMLVDFHANGSLDPAVIIEYSKSYYQFLKRVDKEYKKEITEQEVRMLEFASLFVGLAKRPHELLILELLLEKKEVKRSEIIKQLEERYQIYQDNQSVDAAIKILNGEFLAGSDKTNYKEVTFLEDSLLAEQTEVNPMTKLKRLLDYRQGVNESEFFRMLQDIIAYGRKVLEEKYLNRYEETNLCLYQKYSRKDVCRLLNWASDESSVMYGYKVKYNTCPIFVTYHKSETISESQKYEDKFIDRSTFSWMTRSRLTLESREVQQILQYKQSGLQLHLFVKKEDAEGRDFYYLGRVEPIVEEVKQVTIKDDHGKILSIVNIPMHMREQVQEDVYEYLCSEVST